MPELVAARSTAVFEFPERWVAADLGAAVVLRGVALGAALLLIGLDAGVCAKETEANNNEMMQIEISVRISRILSYERFWWTNVMNLKQEKRYKSLPIGVF